MMNRPLLKIAVVGHTNTGKTSLLRTLTRDVHFGEVSSRPAVTRHVEGTQLLVEGAPVAELYDTPGLEDSINLLELIEEMGTGQRVDGVEVVKRFLEGPEARGRYAQEAKAIRQLLASDVGLYVIDVRDRVLAKHRDELAILARCARPIVPVLNFTARPDARTGEWREHCARLNMHAVAEFDTVVYDAEDERRLFEKISTLLDSHRPALKALIADRLRQRELLVQAAVEVVADLLIDTAAFVMSVALDHTAQQTEALERMRQAVREREQRCAKELLELFRFRPEDYRTATLLIEDARWGLDLFSPEALKEFGIRTGSSAAAGALAGLAVDAIFGGLTFGAAAAIGATIGALVGAGGQHARRLVDRARGLTEVRVDEATLRILAVRQIALIRALLSRGHAAQDQIELDEKTGAAPPKGFGQTVPRPLLAARMKPAWSGLGNDASGIVPTDPERRTAQKELAALIRQGIQGRH
jgi:small GTP-binding protein